MHTEFAQSRQTSGGMGMTASAGAETALRQPLRCLLAFILDAVLRRKHEVGALDGTGIPAVVGWWGGFPAVNGEPP